MGDVIDINKNKKNSLLRIKAKPRNVDDNKPGGIDSLYGTEEATRRERISKSIETIKNIVLKLEKEKALLAYGLQKTRKEVKPTLDLLKNLLEGNKRNQSSIALGTYMNVADNVEKIATEAGLTSEQSKGFWILAQQTAVDKSHPDTGITELLRISLQVYRKLVTEFNKNG